MWQIVCEGPYSVQIYFSNQSKSYTMIHRGGIPKIRGSGSAGPSSSPSCSRKKKNMVASPNLCHERSTHLNQPRNGFYAGALLANLNRSYPRRRDQADQHLLGFLCSEGSRPGWTRDLRVLAVNGRWTALAQRPHRRSDITELSGAITVLFVCYNRAFFILVIWSVDISRLFFLIR